MEILENFKHYGHFTSQLYHLLTKKKMVDASEEIIPSEYIKEMKLTAEERLQRLNDIEIDNVVFSENKKPKNVVLAFSPRIIVFQNFKPNQKIVAKFSVKNVSKALTYINMVSKESLNFSIKPVGGQLLSRLAPGMGVTFAVTFEAINYDDYTHSVSFNTSTEQYVLPIIAMGPRPLFEFPDQIIIPKTPLKMESYVNKIIRNIGKVKAGFLLRSRIPFSVYPKSAYLIENQYVEIKVAFQSMHMGDAKSIMRATLETGEVFQINLISATYAVSIELEKQTVRFLETYNTLVRQQTFKITNKSDHVLSYMCMKNQSMMEVYIFNSSPVSIDFADKIKIAHTFYDFKKIEVNKFNKLEFYDVLSSDDHQRIYSRIFIDEIQELVTEESMFFQNMHFKIHPNKGKLWPRKVTEITITFEPKTVGEHHAVTYLDIDGIIDRVPLHMTGTSIPPLIRLHVETLDMCSVYINKTYKYEIVSMNKGFIDGVIVYKETEPLFGSIISCTPERHCLAPGHKDVFIISFTNSNQGPYFEEINFYILDTDVVIKLYLKGEIIYPTLTFGKPCLNFGKISVGVPSTLELEILNESDVNVRGNLAILSDGPEVSSITLDDCEASDELHIPPPQWPREFKIEPARIAMEPESKIVIKVTLNPNLPRANQTHLELELEKSNSPPITLPVIFHAVVPKITPNPDIKIQSLFLDFPYKCDIIITSDEFWGYFNIVNEDPEDSNIDVEFEVKHGIIKPSSKLVLPVTIKTSVPGKHERTLRMYLFGLSKPIEICHIRGCGVRPIVTCSPCTLQWGQVNLLTTSERTLTLCNDSPAKLFFRAFMLTKDARFEIRPSEAYVQPESEFDLTVSVYLVDVNHYTNKLLIQVDKVKDIIVPLSATGVGTSIVVGELRDKVLLGRHFTRIPLEAHVTMKNYGTRMHSLEWATFSLSPKGQPPPALFFNIEPRIFKLMANDKIELKITGMSNKPNKITETWYLHGSVEGINRKEILMECSIQAEFVDPKIEMSASVVDFRYDYGPYNEYYKLTDIITIKNVSKLPLTIDINVRSPFAIIEKKDTYKIPPEEEEDICGCISYKESDLNVSNIVDEVGSHQSKVFIDFLTRKPVEPLRTGPLHFFQDINKIKMAFNLTHVVEERLEDKEVMKIQVLFDTTKHTNLKSKVYTDIIKAKCRGHKNKNFIKLVGAINFPNMFVATNNVDFQCILNETVDSKINKIQNMTPLLVSYQFQWKKCRITRNPTPTPEVPQVEYDASDILSKSGIHQASGLNDINESFTVHDEQLEEMRSRNVEDDPNLLKRKLMKKIMPMIQTETGPPLSWINKIDKNTKTNNMDINDMFMLIPHRGLLKPNVGQFIQIIFNPRSNISVTAVLECEVLGGPSEYITVKGQSSDLMYNLNTQKLNFKIRSFHEDASEHLYLNNLANMGFEYITYLNEPVGNELQATILKIVPPEKTLGGMEKATIDVIVRPGVIGYFHREFLLEIGHYPHVLIEVFGWGVIPQMYLNLPRPGIFNLDPILGYLAIPCLTVDYLGAITEIFSKPKSEHLNSPAEPEKCFEDPLFNDDWHICSIWDEYPTQMDIELAIERMLVIDHIKARPDILAMYAATTKPISIPAFTTTPYEINFGVVMTGSSVSRVVEITNYGPIATKILFCRGFVPRPWLVFKLCGKLEPGETGKIDVIFWPTPEDFVELEQHLETCINLEVPYGVTMPVIVKALCAVPYLKTNINKIDFGQVRCGDKIICSIPLKNVGKPTCIWYVTLKMKTNGPNPIDILDSSGKYEPGEGGWLSLSFKPTIEMTYEAMLIFRFHMNPKKMTIPVIGHGIFPNIHIIGPKIDFPPTLPWAETTDMYFGITNPCPFPIELIMAHSDTKWKEEEELFNLLNTYYNKPEEILLPAIKPGAGMPTPVMDFFSRFTANVKRQLDEENAMMRSASRTDNRAKKAKQSPKQSSIEKVKERSRVFRSEADIIAAEIKAMKEEGLDPITECLEAMDHKNTEVNCNSKGMIIFVQGSPIDEMKAKEFAYTMGKRLKLPTVNIDQIFVEALCTSSCLAKELILDALNDSCDALMSQIVAREPTDSVSLLISQINMEDPQDEFEIIQKKIELLNSRSIHTPRSKTNEKKKASPAGSQGFSMGATLFDLDLITELLANHLQNEKYSRGFVVDCLTSQVLKTHVLAMVTILKCKSNIVNIHLILCQTSLSRWIEVFEETQRENETMEEAGSQSMFDESYIEQIIKDFEEMDADEFENSAPNLRAIYITHGLEERRRKHLEKMKRGDDSLLKEKQKATKDGSVVGLISSAEKNKKQEVPKGGKPSGKICNEVSSMTAAYNSYMTNVQDSLIRFANNWVTGDYDLESAIFAPSGQNVGAAGKKSKKKSECQLTMSSVNNQSDRGFPVTILYFPDLGEISENYKKCVANMFKTTPFLYKALEPEKEFDILNCPLIKKEYSVVLPKTLPQVQRVEPLKFLYLNEKPIKKCECNQITDLHLLDDTSQENVINILSKWQCVCGKKVTSSQTSTSEIPSASVKNNALDLAEEEDPSPLPLTSVKSVYVLPSRYVLQPGDLVRCKYAFSPKIEGNFSLKHYVEVAGWPDSRVDISVTGICDLPRLDNRPKKMFGNFVRRKLEDTVYKLTYLDDLKMFEFGPIFIGRSRIYEEAYKIDLRNSSLMTADVEIEFLEENDVFQINKTFIRLEPGQREKLTITAAPTMVDVHTAVVLFCIKDNPEIVTVKLGCSGVLPIVEILPLTKEIDYGKLLLYRRENDRFIIKNDSILPIMWKVRNAIEFVEDFIIAETTGIVPRNDNRVVPVTYIACNVGVISNKQMIIEIYDQYGRGDPMVVDHLHFSGECYDVMIECAFDNPNEAFLNFGNVKVNSIEYKEMYFLNKGKYPIYYKLKKVKNFPEPALLKSFEAYDECGVIPPALKLVAVEFECSPTTSLHLFNVPAYTCSLLDGSKEQVVIAKFPVCITIASFYNTFTLFPLGELNFHVIAVGSSVLREVTLNNTSKCPFTYEIVVPEQYRPDPNAPPPPIPKGGGKDNKIKMPPINCGNFFILNEDNLLAPGTSRTIQIQFLATAARKFEETINFIISDTCPAEAHGVPLKLVGTGAVPTLDFWNLENTFRDHLIVKDIDEYKVKESSPHCVFEEKTVTLHFFCVTVNSRYQTAIDLYNNGLVACKLSTNLIYQGNTDQSIFDFERNEMIHLEPLMHKRLEIVFTPKSLEEYRAVLDVKLLKDEEQSFKICLIGEGVIPRIKLLQPAIKQQRLAACLFPMTCLGSISTKVIKFKNISPVKSVVKVTVQQILSERPIFSLDIAEECRHMLLNTTDLEYKPQTSLTLSLVSNETASINAHYSPLFKGRTNCDLLFSIKKNPYEYFTVLCEGEAFMEDVILIGLDMLSIVDNPEDEGTGSSTASKPKSAPADKKNSKEAQKKNKSSHSSVKQSESSTGSSLIKYVLDFGGCELFSLQKRSVIMANNSEKVYQFAWETPESVVIKPSMGYISPGEEKDLEVIFFSAQPVDIKKEPLTCSLNAISDDSLVVDLKDATWDNRQLVTQFHHNKDLSIEERRASIVEMQEIPLTEACGFIQMIILYSVTTEYTKYLCDLEEEMLLNDIFIYQSRSFEFTVENVGNVPMKILWNFHINEDYPARVDKHRSVTDQHQSEGPPPGSGVNSDLKPIESVGPDHTGTATSKETLFSGSTGRESVDTWFEANLPFTIEPSKACLKPHEERIFKVTFSPQEAFEFNVQLTSTIDNLDPYDQNISCDIKAKSLIPYVHLDIEESDYLTSGKRKACNVLPPNTTVLEFNVLGSGCYKKTFNVLNPTTDPYEFVFDLISNKPSLIPFHCNMLKGFVEAGTSTEVTFTFSPNAPGVYETLWRFNIYKYNLVMHVLAVGFVREPDVSFEPAILVIKNSLIGFTTTNVVKLVNNENETLNFEFKGNSLCKESGGIPVSVEPEKGVLKPRSTTNITINYTPVQDGHLSFKIFCSVLYMTKLLTLCVSALSHLKKSTVTYTINDYEHTLDSDVDTNIHLDQTASTYERTVPFKIKNDGSASFHYDWNYVVTSVKKYLNVRIEPRNGFLSPGCEVECTLYFLLKQVPVIAYPVTLSISDGPVYNIFLYAEIKKPLYQFSFRQYDFGKCIIDAPDRTYKRNLSFKNNDKNNLMLVLASSLKYLPELFVDFEQQPLIEPQKRVRIVIYFRPKAVKHYEFKLQFWINSLCEEIITIRGEGVPLLFDVYEGCQKTFNLGPVKVGTRKIINDIEVINHSKVPIHVSFFFVDLHNQQPDVDDTTSQGTSICLDPNTSNIPTDGGPSRVKQVKMFRDDQMQEQIEKDMKNALASVQVVPTKCVIQPHMKVPLKIQFRPMDVISSLNIQLNAKVLNRIKPLVHLAGSATGMLLYFSQNSLQFGSVRKHGSKIMKVMLLNKGDYRTSFNWQPLKSNEFTISPMQGTIDARTNITFTITFRPMTYNPFVKVWTSCNIHKYKSLELALYATCMESGVPQNRILYIECPVRQVKTEYINLNNTSDKIWEAQTDVSGGPFETVKEVIVHVNTSIDIPIHFKPKTMGKHECQILCWPLDESFLFINVTGEALPPTPNGEINIEVAAKDTHTENLAVYNITQMEETFNVITEVVKVIPDKFTGFYEFKHPESIKVWGGATATSQWNFTCYEPCDMLLRVMFIDEETREYQYYIINATVTPSQIMETLKFVCRARETVQQEMTVVNPLDTDSEFYVNCNNLLCEDVIMINRHSEAKLLMTYAPVVVGTSEDFLTIQNATVGTYMYKVICTCLPAKEKNLEYTATFGKRIPIRLRVQNKTDLRADFLCTTSHPSIQLERDYVLGPGEKGKFLIWFEPTEMGVQKCRVSFTSAVAGQFVFKIKGVAKAPTPQGPYEVKPGANTPCYIKFKNVFEDTRTFKIFTDKELFFVKFPLEEIKPKKDIRVAVYLQEHPGTKHPTACLTIETYEPAEPHVQWTYFLKGTV